MKGYFRSKRVMSLSLAFFLDIAVVPGNVGWAAPTAFAAESEAEQSENPGLFHVNEEKAKHDDMKNEKDHGHEGMHGMMIGHSKGWMFVIGVAMIVMMAAHVVVLF